ncbi:SGNH/GDSL hydrolase family protein [Streptomyces sp. O3]
MTASLLPPAYATAAGTPPQATPPKPEPSVSPPPEPGKKLGKGWKSSKDRAVTSAADSKGLRILTADSSKAYGWKTAATLSEPGMGAGMWIGNECSIDADHTAAVYAPRTFTNKPDLMQGGAFTAIVNVKTGAVVKLPFTASLAYFDPSCNPDTRTAAFTAFREGKSRLITVDTSGKVVDDTTAKGQVTSAVPVSDGVVAARGSRLVHIKRKSGKVKNLADTEKAPFQIHAVGGGKVAFLDRKGSKTAHAKLWQKGKGSPKDIATGKLGELSLKQGGTGRVFLTGKPTSSPKTKGTGITALDDVPADADVSSHGRLAVDPVLSPGVRAGLERLKGTGPGKARMPEPAPRRKGAPDPQTGSEPLTVTSTAVKTGKKLTQPVKGQLDGKGAGKPSPTLTDAAPDGARTRSLPGDANSPVDLDRRCSVPRNDRSTLALQPTPNQVEWAVDMAVRGKLRAGLIDQGGWRSQTGLGTIDPQGMFPAPKLVGGGRIPANVLLGVLAQESNLWQAESGVVPGQMGNPLAAVAGFYGHKGETSDEYWKIRWDEADCGYGVGQVTDGMRKAGYEKPGETGLPPKTQRAIALDYTVNIAASMYILADKWNEIHESDQKVTVNNDDPSKPENWFTALWNYNLGFNPHDDPRAPWGLGWYNNPANPLYPPHRTPFLDTSVNPDANHDAAHPQDWPYEEKAMGFTAWSIDAGFSYSTSGRQDWPGESGFASAGFRPAWWVSDLQRSFIKPDLDVFCNPSNNCDASNPETCPDEACYTKYWYNEPNTVWKDDCDRTCGNENIKYVTVRSEPGRGYRLRYGTPTCTPNTSKPGGLPPGALIVESVPAGTQTWSTCGTVQSNGTFGFQFYPGTNGEYEAKGDLHQIGGGYDGHFWYAHTRDTERLGGYAGRMTVKGTWSLGQSLKWSRVFVHLPDTGAHTQQAHYKIKGVKGGDRDRYLNTHYSKNTWVDLGVYQFTGTPRVELTNTTADGDGTADDNIAWDAVAFQPLSGKPKDMIVVMGDSYTSGEGAGDYAKVSDRDHGEPSWNACRRSENSWPRKVVLPGRSSSIGELDDGYSSSVDFQNVSCSGAKTSQVTTGDPNSWGRIGNYHEKTQIDSGVLSDDTTLVMLTIGGNDSDTFTRAVTNCYIIGACKRSDYIDDINQAVEDTGSAIRETAWEASNAQIVLMGYPRMVSEDPCTPAAFDDLNYLADYLRDRQKAKVAELKNDGIKVAFADPIPAFKGHGICDSDEWINGIVTGPNGDGDFHDGDPANPTWCLPWPGENICASMESFHPKKSGTTAYAKVMDKVLVSIGYKGS